MVHTSGVARVPSPGRCRPRCLAPRTTFVPERTQVRVLPGAKTGTQCVRPVILFAIPASRDGRPVAASRLSAVRYSAYIAVTPR